MRRAAEQLAAGLVLLTHSANATNLVNARRDNSSLEQPTPELVPSAEIFLGLGLQARTRKQLDSAVYWLSEGLRHYSKRSDLRTELAMTQAWSGLFEEALQSFNQVLREEPQHQGASLGRARVLLWAGRHAEAETLYVQLLQADPDSLEAMRGLAGVYRANLQFERAERLYQTVLTTSPQDREAIDGLAAIEASSLLRLEVQGGQIRFAGAAPRNSGRLRASYRLNAAWTLHAGHGIQGFSPNRSATGQAFNSDSTRTNIGALLRVNSTWNVGLAYSIEPGGEGVKHATTLRIASTLNPQLNLVGGLRPALNSRGNRELLLDVGVQWLPVPSLWAMLQNFYFRDSEHHLSNVGVGTLNLAPFELCSLRTGGSLGVRDRQLVSALFGGLQVNASSTYQLRLNYERAFLPVERSALHATWLVDL